MHLDVGDIDRIDDPTAAHVRQFLRVLPPAAPYLTLAASAERFVRATHVGESYQVELRDGGDFHRFAELDYERAADVFERFLRGDASVRTAVRWRRPDGMRRRTIVRWIVGAVAAAIALAAALGAWLAVR